MSGLARGSCAEIVTLIPATNDPDWQSITRPTTLRIQGRMYRAVTALFILLCPSFQALPALFSNSEQKHNVTFTISDCSGVSSPSVTVKSYSGTAPASCENAKIFAKPKKRPAQVVSISRYHPAQLVHCLVEVTITTVSCGVTDITNTRNHQLYNKLIYTVNYSPPPIDCYRANSTDSISWITPEAGKYPGEVLTTKLKQGTVTGTHYPYGQPGTVSCTGVTWVDPRGLAQLNAALEIWFKITVTSIWGHFHLLSSTLTIPNILSFPMETANTFTRAMPKKMPPPARHRDVFKADTERMHSLIQLGESAPQDIKRILFAEGYSNDDKLASVANDPFKSELFNNTLVSFHKNFSVI